jgi:hypothetical protein
LPLPGISRARSKLHENVSNLQDHTHPGGDGLTRVHPFRRDPGGGLPSRGAHAPLRPPA